MAVGLTDPIETFARGADHWQLLEVGHHKASVHSPPEDPQLRFMPVLVATTYYNLKVH